MSQQHPDYPRWYVGLRGFIIGAGFGALLMAWLITDHIIPGDPWWHRLIGPAIVNTIVLAITGLFEFAFGIRRYRRLQREVAGRSSTIM